MSKMRKIDYIIEQTKDEQLIFRFYPKKSYCYSSENEPPKSWADVYKVYYSYAIIKKSKFNPEDKWELEIMFYEYCDECSIIDEVGERCLLLADGIEVFKRDDGKEIQLLNKRMIPLGMGTEWIISKRICVNYGYEQKDDIEETYYDFMLFNYDDKGFRFTLNEKNIKSFGEYLIGCCEYMLIHGIPN